MKLKNEEIEDLQRDADIISTLPEAEWGDHAKFHTNFYVALCVPAETLLAEGHPTMEWSSNPWIVELDKRFRNELGITLAEWVEETRELVVKRAWSNQMITRQTWVNKKIELFKQGARIIKDTPY